MHQFLHVRVGTPDLGLCKADPTACSHQLPLGNVIVALHFDRVTIHRHSKRGKAVDDMR